MAEESNQMQFRLYSTDYLMNENHDISVGLIHESIFLQKLEELQCSRIFAVLTFANSEPKYIALSLATDRDGWRDGLYLPHWMIPSTCEMGEEVEVEFLSSEAFPEATQICLRPLDSAFYSTDVREHLSGALTRLGIVHAGSIVHMRLEELGGYEMGFYIVRCEPASLVLCSGDEVAIEFEEASDLWDGRPPTPIPAEPELLIPSEAMIPGEAQAQAQAFQGEGRTLGGVSRRMADGRPWNPWRCPTLPLPREGSNV